MEDPSVKGQSQGAVQQLRCRQGKTHLDCHGELEIELGAVGGERCRKCERGQGFLSSTQGGKQPPCTQITEGSV